MKTYILHTATTPPPSQLMAAGTAGDFRHTPLLRINPLHSSAIPIDHFQAILVTSQHALDTIPPGLRNLPLYTVGPGTAEIARTKGFDNVICGPGTAKDLINLIINNLNPTDGKLYYPCGQDVSVDLNGCLQQHDFQVVSRIVYRADQHDPFDNFLPDSTTEDRAIILLFSKRAAQNFCDLAIKHGLTLKFSTIQVVCNSGDVAETVISSGLFSDVHTCETPDISGVSQKLSLVMETLVCPANP